MAKTRKIDLVGGTEIAALLGVSRQRVAQLTERPDFPEPVARISAGPVWRFSDVDRWRKRQGRPAFTRPGKVEA